MNCTSSFIKLVFSEKIEYKPLKKALLQLITNILNESVDNIIKILNDTILFCFNNRAKERMYYHPFHRKKSQFQLEENSKISESSPSIPFIKSSMKKDFCLVLDIDETISHSLKLSFGYYFLLRPGAIDFLNELSNYYEIDIFTSSLRLYADFIIDKIDTNGNLISYRLYKNHVTYEKGKSIKKLNMIGRDLNKIIFVDNLKSNAKYNLKNLCHISSWTNDIYDKELIKLKNKLKYIATSGKYNDDITKGIK
jgi:TFIIF-interacting CTD phosphatase-like protein